jgi:hypothetical protein
MVGAAGPAYADDCVALGGALVPGECQISKAVIASDALHGGPFAIDGTLRIMGLGSITIPPLVGGSSLTVSVTGDFIMDVPLSATGSRIVGDVPSASGIGATITISAPTGSIELNGSGTTGARITSNQITSCATRGARRQSPSAPAEP